MNDPTTPPTEEEILFFTRFAHAVSGVPIAVVSRKLAALTRAHVRAEVDKVSAQSKAWEDSARGALASLKVATASIDALEREIVELRKDKETLSCALEYAKRNLEQVTLTNRMNYDAANHYQQELAAANARAVKAEVELATMKREENTAALCAELREVAQATLAAKLANLRQSLATLLEIAERHVAGYEEIEKIFEAEGETEWLAKDRAAIEAVKEKLK